MVVLKCGTCGFSSLVRSVNGWGVWCSSVSFRLLCCWLISPLPEFLWNLLFSVLIVEGVQFLAVPLTYLGLVSLVGLNHWLLVSCLVLFLTCCLFALCRAWVGFLVWGVFVLVSCGSVVWIFPPHGYQSRICFICLVYKLPKSLW